MSHSHKILKIQSWVRGGKVGRKGEKEKKAVGVGPDWKHRDWIEFLILRGEGIKFFTRKINQGNFYRVTNTLITYRKSWVLRWS